MRLLGTCPQYYVHYKKFRDIRIYWTGNKHLVFQVSSKNNTYGLERVAKIFRKKNKIWFEFKNKKYYFKDFMIVW